jgi:cellulose synthase/poly-beta-1,6-N-acetylglucosamine synthase-like glycosyltransferase
MMVGKIDLGGTLKDKARDIPSPKEALSMLQNQTFLTHGTDEEETGLTLEADYASLCLLSYERPNFLRDTLKSLKDAPGYPYELIIHDDGSSNTYPDTLLQPVDELLIQAKNEGATVIINNPGHNQGQGISLNRMFSMAKGDPIIKLDADLHYYPGWLRETCRLMRENPSIGLLGLLHYYHEPVDSRETVIERFDEYSIHTHILGSAFALRRSVWEELGPFEEHSDAFAEDFMMQQAVTNSEKWHCALPKESLVENLGMGLGKSVVVLSTEENPGGEVAKIHKEPYIIGKDKYIG